MNGIGVVPKLTLTAERVPLVAFQRMLRELIGEFSRLGVVPKLTLMGAASWVFSLPGDGVCQVIAGRWAMAAA